MSKNTGKFGDGDERHMQTSASGDVDPIPQSLKEVLELMNSINRRLEDCAVEWQSTVSKKQWRILSAKSVPQKPWAQSLLARTYFTDKNLDDAFQKLLAHVRTFMENMNNFIALLRSERVTRGNTKDASTQSPGATSSPGPEGQLPANPVVVPLDLSLLDNKPTQRTARKRRSKRLTDNSISNVQQCFADLIKAKIDLDTKFLGFEAVLNGPTSAAPRSSEKVSCLCQICSNVLEAVIDNEKVLRDVVTKPKVRRVTRATNKRLPQSARIWKRDQDRKQLISLAHMDGKSLISPKNINDS